MDRLKKYRTLLYFSFFIGAFLLPYPSPAKEIPNPEHKTVTVFSESEATVKPEIGIITFHFTGYGWTVDKARIKADQLIQKFSEKISKEKIPIKRMEIGDAKLKPSYQFNRDLKENVPSNFLVSRRVTIVLEDFRAVEKIMDVSISLGSFLLESAVLTVQDKNDLREKAFKKSLEDGRKKAEGIAKSLELMVGGILEIEELDSSVQETNLIQSDEVAEIASRLSNLKAEGEKPPREETPAAAQDQTSPYTESVRAGAKLKITFQLK